MSSVLKADSNPIIARASYWVFLGAFATYLCPSLFAPEFYEQLAYGRWIFAHATVPRENIWSFAGSGAAWILPSWLFSLIVTLCDTYLGEEGLIVLKMLLVFLAVWSMARLFSIQAKNRFLGTALSVLVASGVLNQVELTPALSAWALFPLSLLSAERFVRRPNATTGFLLFAVAALYANLHSSAAILPLAAFIMLAVRPAPASLFRLSSMIGIILLAQLATPYLGAQSLFSLQALLESFKLDVFFQFSPATIYDFDLAFLLLLLSILGVFHFSRPGCVTAGEFVVLSVLLIVGLSSNRVLGPSLLYSAYLVSAVWGRAGGEGFGNFGDALHRLSALLARVSPIGVLWVLSCLLTVNVLNLLRTPTTKTVVPASLVDRMLEEDAGVFPLVHEAYIGGYLVHRFADAGGVPKFQAMMTEFNRGTQPQWARAEGLLQRGAAGWEWLFEESSAQGALCRVGTPLCELLRHNRSWEPVESRLGAVTTHIGPRKSLIEWELYRKKLKD